MADQKYPSFFDGNPRMLFTFGIVTGMVLVLLFNSMSGASAAGIGAGKVANVPSANQPTVNDPTAAAPAGELPAVTKADHVRGDLKKAKVVLVEYADFQCPFCETHEPTMVQLKADYGDDVAWVYRHFPLSFHPNARPSAIASECAAEQGKFWEYSDAMFAGQQASLSGDAATATAFITKSAQDIGLNMAKFNKCLTSDAASKAVDADYQSGLTAGVNGTPATFVNGKLVSGAVPLATLKAEIDAALAK